MGCLDARQRAQAARIRIQISHGTIEQSRQCLLQNGAAAEQIIEAYLHQLHDAIDATDLRALRYALLMQGATAAVWLSQQLIETSNHRIETSRRRVELQAA